LAACPCSRRLVTAYVILFGSSSSSLKSTKEGTTSKSSSEAEYSGMSKSASEMKWIVSFLEEHGAQSMKLVTLLTDNQSAIDIGNNLVFHKRTKHIKINYHFTREKILEVLLQLSCMLTSQPLVDVLIKILSSLKKNYLLSKPGMVPYHSSSRGGGKRIMWYNNTQLPEPHLSHQ